MGGWRFSACGWHASFRQSYFLGIQFIYPSFLFDTIINIPVSPITLYNIFMGSDDLIVKRYQWMRNAEGNQAFGNRMEIRVLDEEAFQKYVLPRLRPGFANSLADYQAQLPGTTHYALILRDTDQDWQFVGVESLKSSSHRQAIMNG